MATTITMQSSTILGNFILVTASFAVLIILIRVLHGIKLQVFLKNVPIRLRTILIFAEEKLTASKPCSTT